MIDAIAQRQEAPLDLADDVKAVHQFCQELIQNRRVSDAAYALVLTHFGERGLVDLMATMSYYTLVSMALNVDVYPLPEGALPELAPY